jgi:hypothetical protein
MGRRVPGEIVKRLCTKEGVFITLVALWYNDMSLMPEKIFPGVREFGMGGTRHVRRTGRPS